jgi:dephospho-CoA kinase
VADTEVFKVALTGSIAMGKSTVANMLRDEGVPVFDADATVHQLYSEGGGAVPLIAEAFPDAVSGNAVDRARLSALVLSDGAAIKRLEQLVHPLVHGEQARFLEQAQAGGAAMVVFDIPLLFEGGREAEFDAVLVVSAPAEIQRQRALARNGMNVEKFEAILARQVPDAVKRSKADIIIPTDTSLDETRQAVKSAIDRLNTIRSAARRDS